MPCSSEHMAPTPQEIYNRNTARLLSTLLRKLGRLPSNLMLITADSTYASTDFTDTMCNVLCGLTKEQMDTIVYDAHDRDARAIATWWEDHQIVDARRSAAEAQVALNARLRTSALEKLTAEERAALGFPDIPDFPSIK